jgi:hypothetical protein
MSGVAAARFLKIVAIGFAIFGFANSRFFDFRDWRFDVSNVQEINDRSISQARTGENGAGKGRRQAPPIRTGSGLAPHVGATRL